MTIPLIIMFFVGAQYLHTLSAAGNDLLLIVGLAVLGLTLGSSAASPLMCAPGPTASRPLALVLMALLEVGARIAVVQMRGRRLATA